MSGIIGVSPDMRSGIVGGYPDGHLVYIGHHRFESDGSASNPSPIWYSTTWATGWTNTSLEVVVPAETVAKYSKILVVVDTPFFIDPESSGKVGIRIVRVEDVPLDSGVETGTADAGLIAYQTWQGIELGGSTLGTPKTRLNIQGWDTVNLTGVCTYHLEFKKYHLSYADNIYYHGDEYDIATMTVYGVV